MVQRGCSIILVLPWFLPGFVGVDKEVQLLWLHVMGMLQNSGSVFATLLPLVPQQFSVRTYFSSYILHLFEWESIILFIHKPVTLPHFALKRLTNVSIHRDLSAPCDGRMGALWALLCWSWVSTSECFSETLFFEDSFSTLIPKTSWQNSSWFVVP